MSGYDDTGEVRDAKGNYRFFDTPDGYYIPTGLGINNHGRIASTIDDDFTTHGLRPIPFPNRAVLLS